MNFRQLDLNLLRVLGAVYRSGSVTEAGHQLALSQPAVSNALARLRRYFEDPLFVPSPGGLHPTRLARRIAPGAMSLLRELEAELLSGESFDPATEAAHWRLSLSDLGEQLFLPRLAHRVRREAPGCRLSNVSVPADRLATALEAMDADVASGLRVLTKTPSYVPHAFAANKHVSPEVVAKIQKAMLSLSEDEAGQKLLKELSFKGVEPATDAEWDEIRRLNFDQATGKR